jgi:hypothetical protein
MHMHCMAAAALYKATYITDSMYISRWRGSTLQSWFVEEQLVSLLINHQGLHIMF